MFVNQENFYIFALHFVKELKFIVMYAIVDIAGQQFKVEKDKKTFVHRLKGEEGSKVEFDKVLLIDNDKSVVVGTPVISGALVKAEIIDHPKGDKVIVFKKKRRKGFKVKNGHRQYFTQILVQEIIEKGAKKAEVKAEKAAPAPKPAKEQAAPAKEAAAEKPKAASTEAKVEKPAAKPTAPPAKKTTTSKTATKPAAEKKAAPAKTSKASTEKKATASKTASKPGAKKPAAKKPAAKKTDGKSE